MAKVHLVIRWNLFTSDFAFYFIIRIILLGEFAYLIKSIVSALPASVYHVYCLAFF